jgi:hypothetical protein
MVNGWLSLNLASDLGNLQILFGPVIEGYFLTGKTSR